MQVLLFNDTATQSHIGCQAVSDAHARLLARLGHRVWKRYFVRELLPFAGSTMLETLRALSRNEQLVADVLKSDILIVNGEGTLHHNQGIEYLGLVQLAKQKKRPIFFVNCLLQDLKYDIEPLKFADGIIVRDRTSLAYARTQGLNCQYAPDSIVAADFEARPPADHSENVIVTDWIKSQDLLVGALCSQLLAKQQKQPYIFLPFHSREARYSWKGALHSLSAADAIVTGRHHAIYLALMSGTPFVPLATNSWKIRASLESFALNLEFPETYDALAGAIVWAQSNRARFIDARKRLEEQLPLRTFDFLGAGERSISEATEIAVLAKHVRDRHDLILRDEISISRRRIREARLYQIACHAEQPSRLGVLEKAKWASLYLRHKLSQIRLKA